MSCHAHALAASRRFLLAEDVDLIREAVATLPQDRDVFVVDLGAGSGTTALSVFSERPQRITVLTVDHDRVALDSTEQCMKNAGHWEHWQRELGQTWQMAIAYHAVTFDMLLVDADHSYEGVSRDLAAWLPLVRVGAPVYCHDYFEEYPGSIKAIDEAVAAGLIAPVKTAGWGWLGVKA